jgi:hypothetical protein
MSEYYRLSAKAPKQSTDLSRGKINPYFRDKNTITDNRTAKRARERKRDNTESEGGRKYAKKNVCRHHWTYPWSESSFVNSEFVGESGMDGQRTDTHQSYATVAKMDEAMMHGFKKIVSFGKVMTSL